MYMASAHYYGYFNQVSSLNNKYSSPCKVMLNASSVPVNTKAKLPVLPDV